jgi:hypothetical protein
MCGSACVYVWVHVCKYARGGWLSRGGALYGASGTMKPVAEPRATGFGSGQSTVVKKGTAVLHRCMRKGLRVAESVFAHGPCCAHLLGDRLFFRAHWPPLLQVRYKLL